MIWSDGAIGNSWEERMAWRAQQRELERRRISREEAQQRIAELFNDKPVDQNGRPTWLTPPYSWESGSVTTLIYGNIQCVFCGRDLGVTTWVADDAYFDLCRRYPDQPEWPIPTENCPSCADYDYGPQTYTFEAADPKTFTVANIGAGITLPFDTNKS